jgi:hypothetical protein
VPKAKDSPEAFEARCQDWFEALETERFGDTGTESLATFMSCEAFEARMDQQRAKAYKRAADAVSYLARILDERSEAKAEEGGQS